MKTIRITNGILLLFVALNAFGGGIYALAGAPGVPAQWLEGTPFHTYLIPGLFLAIVVGGVCLSSAILCFRNASLQVYAARISGLLLLAWIIVQVAIIGYVSWLQPAIFSAGLLIILLSRWQR